MDVSAEKNKIISIQILRAVACLLVLQVHVFKTIPFTSVSFNGAIGVDIFFVISGYIIAASLDKATQTAPKSFFIRRFSRVVPYYYFITLICLALLFIYNQPVGAKRIVRSFLFIPQGEDPVAILGWSLNHEIYFYLFTGLCLLFTKNLKVIALAFFLFLVALNLSPDNRYSINFLRASINFTFLFGFVFYICRARLFSFFSNWYWLLFSLVLLVFVMLTSNEVPRQLWHTTAVPSTHYYFRDVVFTNGTSFALRRFIYYGIPAAFLFAATASHERYFKNRRYSWLVSIGDASYSLYLVQAPLLIIMLHINALNHWYLSLLFVGTTALSLFLLPVENTIGNFFKRQLSRF